MIHRHGYDGPITFECDACGTEFETDEHDFPTALATIRAANWITRKIDNDWHHFCSFDCQKDMTRQTRRK